MTESFTAPVEATCAGAAEALVLPCSCLVSLNQTVLLCSERASSAEVGVRWGARVREQRGYVEQRRLRGHDGDAGLGGSM